MDNLKDTLVEMYGLREAHNILRLVGPRAGDSSVTRRLVTGEPVQYVLGETWFRALKLLVNRHVLIPRPETEELVQWVIDDVSKDRELRILDIGTGSGCVALALKQELPFGRLIGIDTSAEALEVARENGKRLELDVDWRQLDVLRDLDAIPPGDVIVSNPPYVLRSEAEELADNVRLFEPALALFVPDSDPLVFYRHLARLATREKGTSIYVETHEKMAGSVAEVFENEGLRLVTIRTDLSGKERMVRGYCG